MAIDAATGLYYDRARWYNPSDGVFINRRPCGGGPELVSLLRQPIDFATSIRLGLWSRCRPVCRTAATVSARLRRSTSGPNGYDVTLPGWPTIHFPQYSKLYYKLSTCEVCGYVLATSWAAYDRTGDCGTMALAATTTPSATATRAGKLVLGRSEWQLVLSLEQSEAGRRLGHFPAYAKYVTVPLGSTIAAIGLGG